MPSAGRDGWRGAFIVVCGNEKVPVSSMVVDGTGLDGVLAGLFACGAVALESSGGGGELVGWYELDFLGDVEVYLCYAVAHLVGLQCGYDVVEYCHDFVAVAEVDGAERV